MMVILRLLRWPNLLLIILCQLFVKWSFLYTGLQFILLPEMYYYIGLIPATVLIAAGGNIINDIQDVGIDAINKPHKQIIGKKLSVTTAYNWYFATTILGVVAGFITANLAGKPMMASIFIFVSFILYMYATQLKSMLIVGNLVVTLLIGINVLLPGIITLYPSLGPTTEAAVKAISLDAIGSIFPYAVFAMLINFIREVVKDIEDIDGDHAAGHRTLPIAMGRERATHVVTALAVLSTGIIIRHALVYYGDFQMEGNNLKLMYLLFLVAGPLLVFIIRSMSAKKKKDYSQLSLLLKLVLFAGVSAIYIFKIISS